MTDGKDTKQAAGRSRKVIHATCSTHGGGIGWTNLVATKRDGSIELDPHVDGSCVLTLDEDAATALHEALVVGVSALQSVHLVSAHEVVETWRLSPTYTAECGELVKASTPDNPDCPNECDCEVVYCSACLRAVNKRNGVDVDCPVIVRVSR